MRELVFFPTPNWFISRTIDINKKNGSLAITAINSIILTNNLFDEYNFTIKEAHTKRLHGVSFGPENLLASCSEDFDVKVWNLANQTLHFHHKLHQSSVTCIDWLNRPEGNKNDHHILISCDMKGNIFKYDLTTSEHTRFYPESNKPISQLCINPNNSLLAAVGYKHGTIMIIDLCGSQVRLIHKLKSHEDAISCLTWTNQDTLASSGEDRCVRVWRVNEQETEELKCLRVPGTNPGGTTNRQLQQTINYAPLCSPRSGLLLTASYKGELFYFDLENCQQQQSELNLKWTPFISLTGENQHHKKAIFSILSYNDKVITLSLDRLINTWDLNTFKQESSISSVNGFIYSISSSPIDPTFFAVSIGDSSIKFFNEKQELKCTKSFTNNIKTEVTQVSWHPLKENLVAFGTKDGKVGLADIMATNKPAQYIYSNFNQSVYTLIWSEPLMTIQNDSVKISKSALKKNYFLYSVADAKIIQHHVHLAAGSSSICAPNVQSTNFYKELTKIIEGPQEEDHDANTKTIGTKLGLLEFGLTELAVIEKYFAIGKYDGSIEIYQREPNLRRLATLYNHQKLVTCIRWNSISSLFASGSNDFNIIVIDFSKLMDDSNQTNQKMFAQYKYKLSGHKERITGLNWSLINPSLLVSCSYDGTVQIWNGELGTAISNFRGHSEKMLCCVFSNIDTNFVFSGGEDYCLLRWRIDAQKNQTPPDECIVSMGKKRNKIVKKQDKKTSLSKPQTTQISSEAASNHRQPSTESEIDLSEKADEVPNQEVQEKIVKIETQIDAANNNQENKLLMRKPIKSGSPSQRELKTLFVLSSNLGGIKSSVKKLKDCIKLFETLYEKQTVLSNSSDWKVDIGSTRLDFGISNQESSITRLFGNRISVFDMLRLETAELRTLNYEKWWILELWKGDMSTVVAELHKQDMLNELVILVYETIVNSTRSPALINAYIDQLLKRHGDNPVPVENIHKAVLLSLALIDPERAVRIYLEHDLYAYALCISHVRFPPQYHILTDVLMKYASYATSVGDYETAVMCFLRLNDVENAYATLLRRNVKTDEQCASIFADLSQKFEEFLLKSKPK